MGGCCSSTAGASAEEKAAAAELLEKRRQIQSEESGFVANARVDADDDKLVALGLALNDELEEGDPLTEAEEAKLRDEIVAKLDDPGVMDAFDDASRCRIFRGMITNNSGTDAEKVAEAVETYGRVGAWLRAEGDVLKRPVPKEESLNAVMKAHIGGEDLQGHLVWCECLGDIAGVVDGGLTVDEAKAIRMKTMEAVRAAQIAACETRGPRRYKQVYVVDLGHMSITSMTRSSVREMAKVIVTGAGSWYPETAWKLFIVNAPFVFRSAYAAISPLIHPVTKAKIKILGGPSAYLPEMEKCGVPRDAVPACLGGDCPDKPLAAAIEELVADGFPREARPYVPDAPPSPSRRSVSRQVSAAAVEEEAVAAAPSRLKQAAVNVAGVGAGAAVAYALYAGAMVLVA